MAGAPSTNDRIGWLVLVGAPLFALSLVFTVALQDDVRRNSDARTNGISETVAILRIDEVRAQASIASDYIAVVEYQQPVTTAEVAVSIDVADRFDRGTTALDVLVVDGDRTQALPVETANNRWVDALLVLAVLGTIVGAALFAVAGVMAARRKSESHTAPAERQLVEVPMEEFLSPLDVSGRHKRESVYAHRRQPTVARAARSTARAFTASGSPTAGTGWPPEPRIHWREIERRAAARQPLSTEEKAALRRWKQIQSEDPQRFRSAGSLPYSSGC